MQAEAGFESEVQRGPCNSELHFNQTWDATLPPFLTDFRTDHSEDG